MCKMQITRFLAGLFLALTLGAQGFAQSSESRPSDICEITALKAQAGSLIDREVVARAEERAEALKAKLFDLQMQENELQARLEDLNYRLTPQHIQRALALVGSVRPMDELRDALHIRLESEKARVNKLLELLASSREQLEAAIGRADAEIERLHQRLSPP